MPTSNSRNHQFKLWLSSFKSVCKSLYEDNSLEHKDLQSIYSAGIRLMLAAFFRKLAESRSLDSGSFERCFLEQKVEVGLKSPTHLIDDVYQNFSGFAHNSADIPGQFYGDCLQYSLRLDEKGKITLRKNTSRRKTGAFYTPPSITHYLVKETLSPLLQDRSPNEIKQIRVFDPAMGTGNFLIEAAHRLTEALYEQSESPGKKNRSEISRWVATNCLYGVDRDPVAVSIARAQLALTAGCKPDDIRNFIAADSLLDELPEDWVFDVVIGNPPWLTYGLRDVKKIPQELNELYRAKYPGTAEYKISAYALFIEKALSLTRTGGYHGFIVPDSWLTGKYFSKLRNFLLTRSDFRRIVLIKRDFWKGLHIGRSVVYVVQKTAQENYQKNFSAALIDSPDDFREIQPEGDPPLAEEKRSVFIATSRIQNRTGRRIVVYPDDKTRRIVETMEDAGDVLSNYLRFYSGLIGKKGRNSIVIKGFPEEYRRARNIPVYPEYSGLSGLIESGKNLGKNHITFKDCYILHDPKLYKSGYDVTKYRKPKIFLNQTGCTLKACYDDQGFFCLNNLHIVYPVKENIDLHFYAALLNSRVLNFYYEVMSMEQGRALAQTDIDFLHQLPHGTDKTIVDEVSAILKKHQKRHVTHHAPGHIEYSYTLPETQQKKIEHLLAEWYKIPYPVDTAI